MCLCWGFTLETWLGAIVSAVDSLKAMIEVLSPWTFREPKAKGKKMRKEVVRMKKILFNLVLLQAVVNFVLLLGVWIDPSLGRA